MARPHKWKVRKIWKNCWGRLLCLCVLAALPRAFVGDLSFSLHKHHWASSTCNSALDNHPGGRSVGLYAFLARWPHSIFTWARTCNHNIHARMHHQSIHHALSTPDSPIFPRPPTKLRTWWWPCHPKRPQAVARPPRQPWTIRCAAENRGVWETSIQARIKPRVDLMGYFHVWGSIEPKKIQILC